MKLILKVERNVAQQAKEYAKETTTQKISFNLNKLIGAVKLPKD